MEETIINNFSNAINEYLKLIDWIYTTTFILISYYITNEIKKNKYIKYKSIITFIIGIIYSIIYLLLNSDNYTIKKEDIKTIIFSLIFSMFFYSILIKYIIKYIENRFKLKTNKYKKINKTYD